MLVSGVVASGVLIAQDLNNTSQRRFVVLLLVIGGLLFVILLLAAWLIPSRTERLLDQLESANDERFELLRTEQEAQTQAAGLTDRFQESLIPSLEIEDDRLSVVTVYHPGEDSLSLGGDFVDAVSLGNGRCAFVVGDVVGHGPDAAALGATLRAGWRTMIASEPDTSQLFGRLEWLLLHESNDPHPFATASYCLVDADAGEVRIGLAGHPPPFILGPESGLAPIQAGVPLGLNNSEGWRFRRLPLSAGTTLILFTDGLFEGRATPTRPERLGIDRLGQLLSELNPGEVGTFDLVNLLRRLTDLHGGALPDDVAIIAVNVLESGPTQTTSEELAEPLRPELLEAEQILRRMHEYVQASGPDQSLRDTIHPDAEMRLLVSFGRPLHGRDAILAALEESRQAQIYQARVRSFEWLDENTSLTTANARFALEGGGYAEGQAYWLDEIRNELIWAVEIFGNETAARRTYRRRHTRKTGAN